MMNAKVLGILFASLFAPQFADAAKLRYAFFDGAKAALFLKGKSNISLVDACGPSGARCRFTLLDRAENDLGWHGTVAAQPAGNFLVMSAVSGTPYFLRAKIRGRTETLAIRTSLQLSDVISETADLNRVRHVYRYSCRFNYLEKRDGITSPTTFTCGDTLNLCGTSNFCFVHLNQAFHLYGDNYRTNFDKMVPDELYNAGGSGTICGSQIKRFECTTLATGDERLMHKSFGLFGQNSDLFSVPVQLTPGPNQSSEVYGFAAPVWSDGSCAPGLVAQTIFRADLSSIVETTMPSQSVYELASPALAPNATEIRRRGGGTCDGINCSVPNDLHTTQAQVAPFTDLHTRFCVIDPALLN